MSSKFNSSDQDINCNYNNAINSKSNNNSMERGVNNSIDKVNKSKLDNSDLMYSPKSTEATLNSATNSPWNEQVNSNG